MRVATPAQLIGKKSGRGTSRTAPREGSNLRKLFDLFVSQRGDVIELPLSQFGTSRSIDDLRDYYGLDIRRLAYRRWVLAGEWIDGHYIDYIAAKFARVGQ